MATATKRETALTISLGGGQSEQLKLVRLNAYEALSEAFMISIEALALGEIELLPHLGKPAAIECTIEGTHVRYFHGIVIAGQFLEERGGAGFLYRLNLAPMSHFHEQGSNFRIFQNMPVIDIISEVLGDCGIAFELRGTISTRTLAYCVQYGESDFAFVTRLMEEEGLYYFYEHSKSAHKLMICNKPGSHPELAESKLIYNPLSDSAALRDAKNSFTQKAGTFVQNWSECVTSGAENKVTLWDYDFIKPETSRKAEADDKEMHPEDKIEVYRWPGRYYEEGQGKDLSAVLLESRRAQRLRYEGTSRYAGITPGYTFSLGEHPNGRFNSSYLIMQCRTQLADEQYRSGTSGGETLVEFTTIPADVQFRAPIVTPRPVARGPETAVVTGPPGEEIHVDEYGRIKVQFHWDRKGKLDDKSSCWIRVSQTGGLGNIIIPRIGHEVLVDFVNGNPDRPIVVGRVFNASHMPVYPLPQHKTRALWRTKTYKQDTGSDLPDAESLDTGKPGANELRFEDATGKEELFIHAERDMNTRIRHDESHHVGKDVAIKVGKNRTEEVGVNEKITIGANRTEDVKGKETVTVVGDRKVTIKSNDTLKVSKNIKIDAGKEISITAGSKITLTVGSSTITLTPTKIKLSGVMLDMEGKATAKLKSTMTNVEAQGILTAKGGVVLIN
ncbi:MAG: type VI secretion system tip protein TssI/VgrG [Caenibius sp.]